MSTLYLLRSHVSCASIEVLSGGYLRAVKNSEGDDMLTDGANYVAAYFDEETGDLYGFERFGANDPSNFLATFDVVSEHDEDDPDYKRLFEEDDL